MANIISNIDWAILVFSLLFIVGYGWWKTRNNQSSDAYLGGNHTNSWFTVGLGVMATQASAITFLSTPGQAFHDGMGFVQFYFGLPIAMVIICITFIPIYHRLKVYTAYTYLEQRFDVKTRVFTAVLFLIQRGLAAGITIYAPAIIMSSMIGWDLDTLIVIIGGLVILYTVSGGTQAVSITQKQQMAIIMLGMIVAFIIIVQSLPSDISFNNALKIAGASGKMDILDFSFDPNNKYTFWSGITGGTFLALSYFGTDQSQVQRYLTARSLKESRMGLIMNGLLKVPMQFFILLVGVMVFVFYNFHNAPLNFNPVSNTIHQTEYADQYIQLEEEYATLQTNRRTQLLNGEYSPTQLKSFTEKERSLKSRAKQILTASNPDIETNDKDYVFITFILNHLPKGLIGLLMAMILSAAMSSTAAELNALGTTTSVDIYRRLFKQEASDKHYLNAAKIFTLIWGLIAILFATVGTLFENLIQFVNIIGSIFYGTVLGIFIAAFYIKYIKARAVLIAAVITQALIIAIFYADVVSYLWLNMIGAVFVIILALLIQTIFDEKH